MDKKLEFLTKPLVDEAIFEINKIDIPPNRNGTDYAVSIGDKTYPFKLIVTEAAKIAGVDLTSKDFSSNETNRNGFQKITDYPIINLGREMEYFDLKQIAQYKNEVGKQYNSNSPGAKCYNNTRSKLQYLGKQLGELFGVDLINNYNEKPNKMAGQGKGFVQKEYILTGFIPKKYHENGNQIFIKLVFAGFSSEVLFGIDIDVNFSDEYNPFNHNREALQNESQWTIKVDENFPTNWEDLLDVISPVFEKQLKILDTFFSQKATIMNLNNHLNILRYKKQIILQGPPGTGKTREAKLIAKEMLGLVDVKELKNNDQFKLIQFHPSFTYEDFVRGIVAESKGENIEYKNVNKTLGEFAQKALDNFYDSQKAPDEISKESWVSNELKKFSETIQDEIEKNGKFEINTTVSIFGIDSDAFRYNGNTWDTGQKRMKFKDIILEYLADAQNRQDIKTVIGISGRAKEHSSYDFMLLEKFRKFLKGSPPFVKTPISNELKNYILIIDEINRANLSSVLGELIYALEYRGEAVESMYAVEDDNKLILPPNLYIIGTMNTADRSVGHIDYAIRRRFAFMDVLPSKLEETDEIYFNTQGYEVVEKLFNSNIVSNEFQVKDIQIGHSYFIAKKEEAIDEEKRNIIFSMKMEYEIKPILREYLKDGIFMGGKQIDGKDIKTYIEELA